VPGAVWVSHMQKACDNKPEILESAVKELNEAGYSVYGEAVDVTNREQVEKFINNTIAHYGRIDCLINNAGVLLRRTPEEMTEQEWDLIMDVNMKGTFLCTQAVGKYMIKDGGGDIINVASIGAKVALGLRLGYCTSKAAIQHFTSVLADEWGKYNIRINAIAPGYIKSDMNADLRADPVKYKAMVDDVPLGRFGDAEDLLGTIIFLCSGASNFISGQTIYVDGGKTTH